MAMFSLTDTYTDYFDKASFFNAQQKIQSRNMTNIAYGVGAIRQYINHILDDMLKADVI